MGDRYIKQITDSKSLENPTASERVPLWQANENMTITKIKVTVEGGTSPSFTYRLFHGSDLSAAGTAVTDSDAVTSEAGGDVATITDGTIPAGNHIWLVSTAVSGMPLWAIITRTWKLD